MIIQSLCRYYDILGNEESVHIPRPGYSNAGVSFALVISPEGELSQILDLRSDGKKPKPEYMDVPIQKSRANGVVPYFLCDKSQYVFGVEKIKKGEFEKKILKSSPGKHSSAYAILEDTDKDVVLVHQRSRECFEAFKALHHSVLDGLDDSGVKGILHFLDHWNPEKFLENLKIVEYKDDLLTGGNCVFECKGVYLHRNNAVRDRWENYISRDTEHEGSIAQCLVSGDIGPVSRVHQKIKGVVGAQSAGASLVSFNEDIFYSYGKEQSLNAPISESSMFKYTTALNYLLASQRNRIQIVDTTTVFWAETSDTSCEDLANFFFDSREDRAENSDERSKIMDREKIKVIEDILNKVRNGQKINREDLGADPETNFYILGLSPNNARLAVRFWYVDSFGEFINKVARHHLDLEIIRDDSGPRYISVYRLLNETIPRGSEKIKVSPLLGGLVMRSILNNTTYPVQMYNAILNRVKIEGRINYVRAGFIKAYLLRLSRSGLTNVKEDLITMSLNEDSSNVPYRLGRLFAVLEKAQSDTNREMKSTINSKYFSSASTTPAVVFPVLLKLAQHHIARSDWGFKSTQSIEEILAGVDEFPAYLNLEDQGMFMLGYYHQRKAFFKKKENISSEVE